MLKSYTTSKIILTIQSTILLIVCDLDLLFILFRNPLICFSVATPESESSTENLEIRKLMEENKLELRKIVNDIEKATRSHKKSLKKFKKKKEKYVKLMDSIGSERHYLEFKPSLKNSDTSPC